MIFFDWLFFAFFACFLLTKYFCCVKKIFVMDFKMKDVHIGTMIKEELVAQGRSVTWFAKSIYCEKSNVYKMFKRKSIDLEQLMIISQVLDHNFLRDCYEEWWHSSWRELIGSLFGPWFFESRSFYGCFELKCLKNPKYVSCKGNKYIRVCACVRVINLVCQLYLWL